MPYPNPDVVGGIGEDEADGAALEGLEDLDAVAFADLPRRFFGLGFGLDRLGFGFEVGTLLGAGNFPLGLGKCDLAGRRLRIGGRCAAPGAVVAPLLCVVDPRCRIVPPRSVLPFLRAASSPDRRLLRYRREAGVALQHVGMLVGALAHRHLWPEIVRWVRNRAEGA